MSRRNPLLAALFLMAIASPALAVNEWYDYYDRALRHMKAGRYDEALQSLNAAVRLKPASALNERTYGMNFEDEYLPYYQMGVCHLKKGDLNSALRMFNIEESRGVIRRTRLYKELQKQRTQAESDLNAKRDLETAAAARKVREDVERWLKEAADLAKAGRHDEALLKLATAQAGARALDPATQQHVEELQKKLGAERKALEDSVNRQKRIDGALAEARRLVEEGKFPQATVRFDEVLSLDPKNAAALQGKTDAQERVRASETRESLQASYRQGKALFDAGKFQEALEPLTAAATDPTNTQARDLLAQDRKLVEGMRRQKDLRVKLDSLFAEAERLLGDRKFPAATVKFREALDLDPRNVLTQERLSFAERKTAEQLFSEYVPNKAPALIVREPQGLDTLGGPELKRLDVEGPTFALVGVATDDRGVAKVEFRLGGRLVAEQTPQLQPETGEALYVPVEREFPLEEGANEIGVTVVDTEGRSHVETFSVTRHLRFYETRAFLPSAFGLAATLVGGGLAFQRARRRRAVRRRFNPYIAGAPVMSDDMFFGRTKLLTRMMNVLHHNSLMITGERRIGKTTFLYHLKKALESDEGSEYRFFPVFTDLQGVPESGFFHAVMSDTVEALSLSPATLQALRFRSEDEAYDGRDFSHDLQRVVEELKTRTPKQVKLALLIDEVDVLNEYSERINQRLRSIFMKTFSEHLVAIMSGVGIKRAWKSEGSPWYNFFDEIELTAFSRDEAEDLIRTPVEGYFRYQPEAVDEILALSELKPYVIQKFCIHSVNRMLEEGRTVVTARDVETVRDTVRFERDDETSATAVERPPAGVVAD